MPSFNQMRICVRNVVIVLLMFASFSFYKHCNKLHTLYHTHTQRNDCAWSAQTNQLYCSLQTVLHSRQHFTEMRWSNTVIAAIKMFGFCNSAVSKRSVSQSQRRFSLRQIAYSGVSYDYHFSIILTVLHGSAATFDFIITVLSAALTNRVFPYVTIAYWRQMVMNGFLRALSF